MKKIVLLVAFCLSIGNVFAQDAEKLRDEGDAALKAKNYPEAVAKYGEYLKLTEYKDTVRIFNCGFSANQAKMYEEAAKYFDMAVKYNYNLDDSYTGEAMAYRNLNKTEEFVSTVEAGFESTSWKRQFGKVIVIHIVSNKDRLPKRKVTIAGAEALYKNVFNRFQQEIPGRCFV